MPRSKRDKVLELFFNQPTKQWHFEELCRQTGLNRKQVLRWLNLLRKEHLIKRVKLRGKMPYYHALYEHPNYQHQKRIFALQKLHQSGLLPYLQQVPAQTIILFGSMARWDWHEQSDIDLFVYGNTEALDIGKFEIFLGRDIQVFACKERKELADYPTGLLKNILKGDFIKGNLDFVEVHADGRI